MDTGCIVRGPEDPPPKRRRGAAAAQRGASGEGSRSAMERLIEQEKEARRRALAYGAPDEPDGPDELPRGPRP